jgi:Reprolysin (M12B) family zinc metalloprotease
LKISASQTPAVNVSFNQNKNSRYIELLIVVDHKMFNKFDQKIEKAHQYCKDLVVQVNSVRKSSLTLSGFMKKLFSAAFLTPKRICCPDGCHRLVDKRLDQDHSRFDLFPQKLSELPRAISCQTISSSRHSYSAD